MAKPAPTPTIDLIFDPDCPHVDAARENLRAAIATLGIDATWREHRIGDPLSPPHVRSHNGSPTILVDSLDVAPAVATGRGEAECCRVYASAGTLSGAPSIEDIATALARGKA